MLFIHKPDLGPTDSRQIANCLNTPLMVWQSLLRTTCTLRRYRWAQLRQLATSGQFCIYPILHHNVSQVLLDQEESPRTVATVIAQNWPAKPLHQRRRTVKAILLLNRRKKRSFVSKLFLIDIAKIWVILTFPYLNLTVTWLFSVTWTSLRQETSMLI